MTLARNTGASLVMAGLSIIISSSRAVNKMINGNAENNYAYLLGGS